MKHLLSFLLLALLVLPTQAQQTPPPGGEPKDFDLPNQTNFTLDNGLQVTLVPYGALPKVSIQAVVQVGNVDETSSEVWLADLMGDLMQEGTTTRSSEQIAQEAAQMGGSVNIGVGLDQTTVSGTALSEFGPDMVALMADVLLNPSFPENELDRLKRDRLRQVSIAQTQPGTLAQIQFREVMYGDHPYGRLFPTEAMLNGYTLDDIRSFYTDNFGANRTHIYISGMFNARAMERAVRDAFSGWAAGSDRTIPSAAPTSQRAIYFTDIPGAAQSNVYIGLPTIDPSHPDYVAMQVTNSLLGGSFGSRITRNIREDKGYTYSPFSQVSSRYRDAFWAQVAAITTEVTGAAIQEIFFEIDRLRNEPPSAEELDGIKNYMAGTFVLQNSSRQVFLCYRAHLDLHGLPGSYLTNYVQNVFAVTPADVQRIMQEYIRPDEMMIVIAGDEASVRSQVTQFGSVMD